jgi:hypothetical protein
MGALVCAPDAFAGEEQSVSPYEHARLVELEFASLSADRIADYLMPERDASKLVVELIFDRHEHYNQRTPATALRFERDGTGLWKGQRVEGQIPIGSAAYWAFEIGSADTGFVCTDRALDISSDVAQSLHALVAADWEEVPQFTERQSSHPTMIGVRLIDDEQRSERYFQYLQSPEDLMFDLPPELAEQFEQDYVRFERFVVELVRQFDGGRTDCEPAKAVRKVLSDPALNEQHAQEFAQIRASLNIAYAATREVRESKE